MKNTAMVRTGVVDLSTEKQFPLLQFLVFRKMAYNKRRFLFAGLVFLGLAFQVYTLQALPGFFFIAFAVMTMWVVGFDSQVDYHHMNVKETWVQGAYEHLSQIVELDRKQERWTDSVWDFSSINGKIFFVVSLVAIVILTNFIKAITRTSGIGGIVFLDGIAFVSIQWFKGMRRTDRRPELVQKADHLVKTVDGCPAAGRFNKQLGTLLLMDPEGEGKAPSDLKLNLSFPDGPDHFYGLQGQVALNRVQGKAYPYFYAVVVCKEGHVLDASTRNVPVPDGIVREVATRQGADVVILRQHTTDTSGYHTTVETSGAILTAAIQTAECFLARRSDTKSSPKTSA
ncbi:MAG: hypothetical protein HKM93_20995 [Desulfobacteraceae bacterium]|nr:hypothetical protein [Desulfobacteraceae bacterium]